MTDEELHKIRAKAGRKGGKAKVKKGFAVSGLAKEAGRKGAEVANAKKSKEFTKGLRSEV